MHTANIETFIENLHGISEKRQEFAEHLNTVAQIIQDAEVQAEETSGKFNLAQDIADLKIAGDTLAQGRFRLMVLGDMKHGKSTLLNVLLGKDLLPRAVNPCTAILTQIQYGSEEKVTIHFKDGATEAISFTDFKQRYTIDPNEAKRLELEQEAAFPDVNHAVVEYPLDLLQNGVEIIDSPGLNDTDERNQLTLSYINRCHAILFVLNATKPCTMEERRYLENYIKGRGLTVFFLVNRWDELQKSALDPDDPVDVLKVETEQRQVFRANLYKYCQIDERNYYDERVFETSALNALRCQLRRPPEPLNQTGLPEFIGALEYVLTKERAVAELRQARTLMRQVYQRISEAVRLRIPLLNQDVNELRQRVQSVEPEFNKLRGIRDSFRSDITQIKEIHSDAIAESAFNYLSHLDDAFQVDFKPYMPDLSFLKFLQSGQRKKFEVEMEERFEKYINDRLAEWGQQAEQDLKGAFTELTTSAGQYGAAYSDVTDQINTKLAGGQLSISSTASMEAKYPGWARFATSALALLSGDIVGAAGAGLGAFNWRGLLVNISVHIGVNLALLTVFNCTMGPIFAAVLLGCSGAAQMEGTRRKFIQLAQVEMKKFLPDLAREQSKAVYREVSKLFDTYDEEVSKRLNEDIEARQVELVQLIEQTGKGEFQREAEVARLKELEHAVYSRWQLLESAYDKMAG